MKRRPWQLVIGHHPHQRKQRDGEQFCHLIRPIGFFGWSWMVHTANEKEAAMRPLFSSDVSLNYKVAGAVARHEPGRYLAGMGFVLEAPQRHSLIT